MRAPLCLLLLGTVSLIGTLPGAEGERRMRQELLGLVQEDRSKYPVDPRLEDLSPEEQASIEPAPPAEPTRTSEPAASGGGERAVMMAPVIVEERRSNPLTRTLHEHDRAAAAEEARTVPTLLDSILNHPRLSIFGGYNARTRAAIARQNLRIMEVERMLLIAIQMAQTEAEKQELRAYLAELRAMRRW